MRGDEHIIRQIKELNPCDLSFSAITLAEIYCGIEKSSVKKEIRRQKIGYIASQLKIFSFDEKAADQYGPTRALLERCGTPISERDLQIASIALAYACCLVTHNIKEFNWIPNLEIEDWAVVK